MVAVMLAMTGTSDVRVARHESEAEVTRHRWKPLVRTGKANEISARKCEKCGLKHRVIRRGSFDAHRGYNMAEVNDRYGWRLLLRGTKLPPCAPKDLAEKAHVRLTCEDLRREGHTALAGQVADALRGSS